MTRSLTVRSYQNLAVIIEGFGTIDGNYRYCLNNAPSWDSDNLYHTCLVSWPDEIGSEVDFKTGTVSQTGLNLKLRRTELTLQNFWTVRQPYVIGRGTSVSSTDTEIDTDVEGSLENTLIYWERECILMGTHTENGTYTGCQRAQLGTTAITHGDGSNSNKDLFLEMPINSYKGRKVTLIRVPSDATSYDDEEIISVFVLDQKRTNGITFELICRDALSLLQDFNLMQKQATFDSREFYISDRRPDSGYGDLGDETLQMIVADKNGKIGKVSYEFFLSNNNQVQYRLRRETFSPVLQFPLLDTEGEVFKEILTTHIAQPSNNSSADTFTLPLSQDAAIVILQLLTSTANDGQPGGNGEYDTGINNIATSIPIDLIDVDAILSWGYRHQIKVDNLFIGLDSSKETTFDIIEKILHPLGSVLLLGKQGKLTVASLSDTVPFDSNNEIVEEDILSIGNYQDSQIEDSLDRVVVEYAMIPGVGSSKDDTIDALKGRYLPAGSRSQIEIDATSYSSRYISRGIATNLLFRYRFPPPIVILETQPYLNLYPGDVCRVSHTQLLGNQSVGWVEETCLVIGRKEVYDIEDVYGKGEHYLVLTLAWVGAIYDGNYNSGIAPSAYVTGYNSMTRVISIAENVYVDANNPLFERDSQAFYVLDKVQICDEYGTVKEAVATISVVGTNQLTLLLTPTNAPVSGDIIRMSEYTQANSNQRQRWAFIANTDDEVGGSVNNGYKYVIG